MKFLRELKRRNTKIKDLTLRSVLIAGLFVLAGCEKAEIRFVSAYADKQPSGSNCTSGVKWSIAMSKDEIVEIYPQMDVDYNTTQRTKKELGKLLIFNWLRNGEEGVAQIRPGVYDWLIVMDKNGDGCIDSYYGTRTTQVKLHRFEFVGGKHYKVNVRDDSNMTFTVD